MGRLQNAKRMVVEIFQRMENLLLKERIVISTRNKDNMIFQSKNRNAGFVEIWNF